MELTAADLLNVLPDQRGSMYRYPYTGPYNGEPELYEILHRQEENEIWGSNTLTIYKTCPACGNPKAEWIRNEWAVCFPCLLAFDMWENYIDITIDEEMELSMLGIVETEGE